MELDLGSGRIALIDDADWTAERCNYRKDGTIDRVRACDLSWYAKTHDGRSYVWSCYRVSSRGNDHRYSMNLHRLITECPADKVVDHIDGNPLDNRRINLRICEQKHNIRNQVRRKRRATCPYKGVTLERGRYRARCRVNGVQQSVAHCETALEAALAYDAASIREYGEFARPNFPERHKAALAASH